MKTIVISVVLAAVVVAGPLVASAQNGLFRKVAPTNLSPQLPLRINPNDFGSKLRFSSPPPWRAPLIRELPAVKHTHFNTQLDPYVGEWNPAAASSYFDRSSQTLRLPTGRPSQSVEESPEEATLTRARQLKERWWNDQQKDRLRRELKQRIREQLEDK